MEKPTVPEPIVPDRERVNITMPGWVREDATKYGAKRGYGMSELVTRLLEKFIEEEKLREAAAGQAGGKPTAPIVSHANAALSTARESAAAKGKKPTRSPRT